MKLFLILVVASVASAGVEPPTPVSNSDHGFYYDVAQPAKRPRDTLEVFIDQACINTFEFWGTLKKLRSHFGESKLNIILHQVPLPIHKNAFVVSQGTYVIQKHMPEKIISYLEYFINRYRDILDSATQDMNRDEIVTYVAEMAQKATGMDVNKFRSEFLLFEDKMNQEWQYTSSRLANRTPMLAVNGHQIGHESLAFDDLVKFLTPIIEQE